jgi:hypothetical protein
MKMLNAVLGRKHSAQALAKSGKLRQAGAMSAELQKDAHARGYKQIERDAADLSKS